MEKNLVYDADLTVGDVAKMCRVSSGTVRNWCERELIPFRTLPGNGYRRFKRADVLAFADQHAIDLTPDQSGHVNSNRWWVAPNIHDQSGWRSHQCQSGRL